MDLLIEGKLRTGLTEEFARNVVRVAGNLCKPPCIYAVEKDGLIELRNYTYKNKLTYRSSVGSFVKQGFKVYGREE